MIAFSPSHPRFLLSIVLFHHLPTRQEFQTACRCDADGNCLDAPLPRGAALNFCVFATDGYTLSGVKSLTLTQEDFIEVVVDQAEGIGVEEYVPTCDGGLCMISFAISESFYGQNDSESLTASGVASISKGDRILLRGLQGQGGAEGEDYVFASEVSLDSSTPGGPNGAGDSGTGSGGGGGSNRNRDRTPLATWLVPLVIVILLLFLALCLLFSRRNNNDDDNNSDKDDSSSVGSSGSDQNLDVEEEPTKDDDIEEAKVGQEVEDDGMVDVPIDDDDKIDVQIDVKVEEEK